MVNHWLDTDLSQRRHEEGILQRLGVRVAMVATLLGALVVVFAVCGGEDEEKPLPEQIALGEAAASVASGYGAAHEQLERKAEQIRERERRQYEAKNADWEPGEEIELRGTIEPGQSVYEALVGRGIPDGSVFRVLTESEDEIDFHRSRAGDIWHAGVGAEGRVERLRFERSPERIWVAEYDEEEGEYQAGQKEIELETGTRGIAGEVDGSFWLSIAGRGESDLLAHRFMKVFEYTVDFNTETRDGDIYAMIIEEKYLDGEFLRYGRVVGALYIGDRGVFEAYYFDPDDDDEEAGYFDEDGESLQRQFLRSPLEVTRVTSGFGRRQHPISGDERMHHGVDYGAPEGTPVQATADGEVVFAGWSGGYGKLLKINHRGGYQTRFAHLSRFEAGVTPGARVSQGDIVARSGNTGASTAPHLHYEMLRDGQHMDPLTVDAGSGEPLAEAYQQEFQDDVVEPVSEKLRQLLAEEAPEGLQALGE